MCSTQVVFVVWMELIPKYFGILYFGWFLPCCHGNAGKQRINVKVHIWKCSATVWLRVSCLFLALVVLISSDVRNLMYILVCLCKIALCWFDLREMEQNHVYWRPKMSQNHKIWESCFTSLSRDSFSSDWQCIFWLCVKSCKWSCLSAWLDSLWIYGKKMLKKLPSVSLFTAYQLNHILTIPCLQCLHIWFSCLVQLSQTLKGHWMT